MPLVHDWRTPCYPGLCYIYVSIYSSFTPTHNFNLQPIVKLNSKPSSPCPPTEHSVEKIYGVKGYLCKPLWPYGLISLQRVEELGALKRVVCFVHE